MRKKNFIPENFTLLKFENWKGKLIQNDSTKEKMYLQAVRDEWLEILQIIESGKSRPRALQKISLLQDPDQNDYLLTGHYPFSFEDLIKSHKSRNQPIPFAQLISFFSEAIRVLAYLQSKRIACRNVNPDHFRLDEGMQTMKVKLGRLCAFFPQYSRSDQKEVKLEDIGKMKREYLSPELCDSMDKTEVYFDPFKSDVFSFGLTFIELSTFNLPSLEKVENSLDDILEEVEDIYGPLMKNEEEKMQLSLLQEMLSDCLQIEVENRRDFIEMFFKSLDFRGTSFFEHYQVEEKKGLLYYTKDSLISVHYISDSADQILKLQINLENSVGKLKKNLENLTNLRVSSQRLFLGQIQLEDDKPLSDYEITAESTIFLVPLQPSKNPLKPSMSEKRSEVSLKIEDFYSITKITSGAFGSVSQAKNKACKSQRFAIKTMNSLGSKSEKDIEKEIEIWEKLGLDEKPRAVPNFHGFIPERSGLAGTNYHLVFDYFPKTLADLISELKHELTEAPFPFMKLHAFAQSLINSMAFLQSMNLCHRDLKPANLLLNEAEDQIFLIDLGEAKEMVEQSFDQTKKLLTIAGTKKYMSPEIQEAMQSKKGKVAYNPFKSDVFSFGLVFLELGTLELPQRNERQKVWRKNIESLIKKFKKTYRNTVKDENEKFRLKEFVAILGKCLELDPMYRPDFYRLFYRNLRFENTEKFKNHILLSEQEKT